MFGKKKKAGKMVMDRDSMFSLLLKTMDSAGWKYEVIKDHYIIQTGCMGDDLVIGILIQVREVSFHIKCMLDFVVEEARFSEVCWNLNNINKDLSFGAFYLNSDDGSVSFEYGMVFVETKMSMEFLTVLISMLTKVVDEHDGDLMKIATRSGSSSGPMYG